jgi:hypothetical protein
MTELIVKVFFGLAIFFIAIYYGTKFLAKKAHPETQLTDVTPQVNEDLHKEIEKELFNTEERQAAKKESKPEFPIDKPKKKRKYYPKKKQ